MGGKVCLAVGVIGNTATLFRHASPISTFAKIIRNRSTGNFSCIPYIFFLLNSLLYFWYGMPIVSHRWEMMPLVTISGLGILFQSCYILVYLWFASTKERVKVSLATVAVIIVFCIVAVVSTFALQDHHHRKLLVGSIVLLSSVVMYGSPLVVVKQVIETKSVEFMPFYLSFSSLLSSSTWMIYGLMSHDLFIASPNFVGCSLTILQLLLYCKYGKKTRITEEQNRRDLENNDEKSNNLQLVTNENTNSNI